MWTRPWDEGDPEGDDQTITFDEFVVCLALCGHIKYEEVEQMSLAQRVAGIVANYLGEKDEQAVITEAVVPPPNRLDVASVVALPGQDPVEHNKLMQAWGKMDLGHVYGFPLWEKEVFTVIQRLTCCITGFPGQAVEIGMRHSAFVQ